MIEDKIFDRGCDIIYDVADVISDILGELVEWVIFVLSLFFVIPLFVVCMASRFMRIGVIRAWRFIKRWWRSDDWLARDTKT